jgi:hypothetical protein
VARLPADVIVRRFLASSPDLTEQDVLAAFAPPAEAGTSTAATLNPSMFGD